MRASVEPVTVGVIGCGVISGAYLQMLRSFPALEVVACADLVRQRAEERAAEFGVPRVLSVEELLADPGVEVALNLTVPQAHAEVALAAVRNGKSVYNEKPLAIAREDGRRLLDTARANGVLVGCAPDTFLGGGLQTVRKLIDDGWIGQPTSVTAFMQQHGPERWHPNPDFFYQRGGGPLFDLGPYYLTTLVSLFGPVGRVAGLTSAASSERTITAASRYGERIPVETPTHVAGLLEFAGGVVGTLIMSFDVWGSTLPPIEIHGTQGSLRAPDPNTFGGPIWLRRAGEDDWREVPLAFGYTENSRGLGVADLSAALRNGRRPRANGELAYHVLDVMSAFEESSTSGAFRQIESSCERPAPLPMNLLPYELDG